MSGALPPVGWRTRWQPRPCPDDWWPGWTPFWLDSGTSALALAFASVRHADPAGECTVLAGAYGCPDVVAAAVHAGCRMHIVDTLPDSHRMDPGALARALAERGSGQAVIVAMNFLGIAEDHAALAELAVPGEITVLQDLAQAAPLTPVEIRAPLVVTSNGRGKPVSLLGGGALLVSGSSPLHADIATRCSALTTARPLSRLAALAGNAALDPHVFAVLRRLPGLHVGATTFHPLAQVQHMDSTRRSLLAANLEAYARCGPAVQRAVQQAATPLVEAGLCRLPPGAEQAPRLLRLPLLARDAATRDALLAALDSRGLGASPMYGRVLPDIDGVAAHSVAPGKLAGARAFAARLLTLPVHAGVTGPWIRRLRAACERLAARQPGR